MSAYTLPPLETVDLFPPMHDALMSLLRGLDDAEWDLPTVCEGWSVKDVGLHLLGGAAGILSRRRDGHSESAHITTNAELVAFINARNDLWVRANRRLSPRLLCDLLDVTVPQMNAYFASLDQNAPGGVVSWAGPDPAPHWLDTAREYTEFWHHQQHIRDAVGEEGLKSRRFLYPALDAFLRALPFAYRDAPAPDGTRVTLHITGEADGKWSVMRSGDGWRFADPDAAGADCAVTLDGDSAWRLCTLGIDADTARERAAIEGDPLLAEPLLHMVSIIA